MSRHHCATPTCSAASSAAPGEQSRADRVRVADGHRRRRGQRHVAQRAGRVQGHHGGTPEARVAAVDRPQCRPGRDQQHVGGQRVGHPPYRPGEPAALRGDRGGRHARRDAERHGHRGRRLSGCEPPQQVRSGRAAGQQRARRDDRAAQVRHRGDRPAELLEDDGDLAPARPRSPGTGRDGEAGESHLAGELPPQLRIVRFRGLDPGQHRGRRAARAQQVAHRGAQLLLHLRVAQVHGHRGRSFHGTSLSARGSTGSPSTRSAMMLRRISEVPPSIELPFARR